jgi:hypothetical protein
MKKPALDFPRDQPIVKHKRKQSAISQKTASKKVNVTSSKQLKSLADATTEVALLLSHNYTTYLCIS